MQKQSPERILLVEDEADIQKEVIRQLATSPPMIFVTARVQPHEVAHYEEPGALGVIFKPFDPMQLATTVRKIWSRYVE